MKLIIAEKPSLGKAIADYLAKKNSLKIKNDSYNIFVGDYCIINFYGHVFENYKPEDYNESYKIWNKKHLPIIPNVWKIKPVNNKSVKSLLKELKAKLFSKEIDYIIHAGDPDREGQLLIDEALFYFNNNIQVKRILINDPSYEGIESAFLNIQDNNSKVFRGLYNSSLTRTKADWLLGYNLTRAFTLKAKELGCSDLISIGRVQTPLLGLIVKRYMSIKDFKKVKYHSLTIKNQDILFELDNLTLNKEILDQLEQEHFLILKKTLADNICLQLSGNYNLTFKCEKKEIKSPLLFNLSDLQISANNFFDFSADETLEICQTLYESYKCITYPRSDCNYLPEVLYKDRYTIINNIIEFFPDLNNSSIDKNIKPRSFNTKQITAHHAIIPTFNVPPSKKLNEKENLLYKLICVQYLSNFLPAAVEQNCKYLLKHESGATFKASEKRHLSLGWKSLYEEYKDPEHRTIIKEEKEEDNTFQTLICQPFSIEKYTKPLQNYTEAKLLSIMNNINRYINNEKLKVIDKLSLGTPATQSSMIKLLFERKYIVNKGKTLIPTNLGIDLISSLPDLFKTPDLSALWEIHLQRIEKNELDPDKFLRDLHNQLPKLISYSEQLKIQEGVFLTCPKCGKGKILEGNLNYYCSKSNECSFVIFKNIASKRLSKSTIEKLIQKGYTGQLKGFISKKESKFSAILFLDKNDDFKVKFRSNDKNSNSKTLKS